MTKIKTSPLQSPKQRPLGPAETWYRYYAGYADGFVQEIVKALPRDVGLLLDPWNGSGTTTHFAASHGHAAFGYDVNPAAVVVGKSRLLNADVSDSLLPLTMELLGSVENASVADDDLLLRWLTPKAVHSVRRLTKAINRALVTAEPDRTGEWVTGMSSLAAVFYVGIFRVVRDLLSPFVGTNPTWIRQRVAKDDRLDFDLRSLRPRFIEAMMSLARLVGHRNELTESGQVNLALGDSTALPLEAESVDTIITSPPYCTRIDYAVATLPELGTLDVSPRNVRKLRDRLIGTPTITPEETFDSFGPTANQLLQKVKAHTSRASDTYYARFFHQYLTGMNLSLKEISRTMASEATAVIVVQDSYYKEIHVDVPAMISEFAQAQGWIVADRTDYKVPTRASMNTRARQYRDDRSAVEAVLVFNKG